MPHYKYAAPPGPAPKQDLSGEWGGPLSAPKVDPVPQMTAWGQTQFAAHKSNQKVKSWNDRDRSMYLNFQWWLSRLPTNRKVIVWAATVHVAKSLSGIDGFEGKVPLGSYIRRDFGERAFSLGFSAYSGSYAFVGQPVRELSAAPDSSLEWRVFANRDSDTVYIPLKQLRKFGSVGARPLGTDFKTARWDEVLDGLVVFRRERAPQYLPR